MISFQNQTDPLVKCLSKNCSLILIGALVRLQQSGRSDDNEVDPGGSTPLEMNAGRLQIARTCNIDVKV